MKKKTVFIGLAVAIALLGAAALVKQRIGGTQANATTAGSPTSGASGGMKHGANSGASNRVSNGVSSGVSSGASSGPGSAPSTIEFSSNDLMTLAPSQISKRIPITGSLQPTNQTMVKSKVAGEIKQLLVSEGIGVKAGQVIARIDPTEFEWRVNERESLLRAAEAQLAQAKQTLANNRQLLEKNFISQSAFDTARFTLDSAQGNRDAAAAQLRVARKALADSVVLAPMSGLVGERFARVGEKVSPDNRIVSIIDLSRMEIEAPVPASDIGAVQIGQEVRLSIEGIAEPQIGKVTRINPSTQAGTRSVPIHLALDNKDPRIRAGLFAQGQLVVGVKTAIISVPENSLRDAAGRIFVYLIEGDKVIEREVELGLRDDSLQSSNGLTGMVEIKRGLKAGDRIVAVNLGPLRGGSLAKVSERKP